MAIFDQLIQRLPRVLRRQRLLASLAHLPFVDPVREIRFNVTGRAYVDLRDAESRAHYLAQQFNEEFFPIFRIFTSFGGHFFDAGSNFGLFTFGLIPSSASIYQWHLFEANGMIIPALNRSVTLFAEADIVVNHCCVTNVTGFTGHSLVSNLWGQGQMGETGNKVINLVLDEYISERGIECIAFLKMDIEGWEKYALSGATTALSTGVVKAGWIELHPVHLVRTGTTPNEILTLLADQGFDCYWCGLWDYGERSHLYQGIKLRESGACIEVNGTRLRVTRAVIDVAFLAGDVLIIHKSSVLSGLFARASVRGIAA
jgi:FkbM family methyltransferase